MRHQQSWSTGTNEGATVLAHWLTAGMGLEPAMLVCWAEKRPRGYTQDTSSEGTTDRRDGTSVDGYRPRPQPSWVATLPAK